MRIDPWPFIIGAYAIAMIGTLVLTFSSWRAMRRAERDVAALGERQED